MIKKGKFIVIEGIDSSGKGLQMKLLLEKLKKKGHKVLSQGFPRYYDSPFGKMVGEFLTGKYGNFKSVDPHVALPLYMLDEYTWCRDIGNKWLGKGGTILLDRYFTSCVHQVAKKNGRAKKVFRDWMWDLGYNKLGIIKPDLVLFLDIPISFTKKLSRNKSDRRYLNGKKKDQAEKNWDHQVKAYKEYIFMTKNNSDWIKIECVTKSKLEAPEIIHGRIWKVVKGLL